MAVAKLEIEDDSVVFVDEREQPRLFARVRNVDCIPVLREDAFRER
jgi:hypothetical protein